MDQRNDPFRLYLQVQLVRTRLSEAVIAKDPQVAGVLDKVAVV